MLTEFKIHFKLTINLKVTYKLETYTFVRNYFTLNCFILYVPLGNFENIFLR